MSELRGHASAGAGRRRYSRRCFSRSRRRAAATCLRHVPELLGGVDVLSFSRTCCRRRDDTVPAVRGSGRRSARGRDSGRCGCSKARSSPPAWSPSAPSPSCRSFSASCTSSSSPPPRCRWRCGPRSGSGRPASARRRCCSRCSASTDERRRRAFPIGSPAENILATQFFLIILNISMLFLSAAFVERQAALVDRQDALTAVNDSEARYRSVVEHQTELICRYRADTTLTFVNDAYCRFFGRTPAELHRHAVDRSRGAAGSRADALDRRAALHPGRHVFGDASGAPRGRHDRLDAVDRSGDPERGRQRRGAAGHRPRRHRPHAHA